MSHARQRPLVGVSTYRQTTSWWSWERDAALVPGVYLDVLEAAGGQPVLIPPRSSGSGEPCGEMPDTGRVGLDSLMAALDGLILIGGGDIEAGRYGQDADPRNGGSSGPRDDVELALLDAALGLGLPVLAVCRGMQVLNVYLGGDLVQQLPDVVGSSDHQPRPGAFGPITVLTEPGSEVRRVLGERVDVLCSHHQAIATLGRGLTVTARSGDGVIEAVELRGRRFVLGVQWHPEETGDRRLFEALVDAARTPFDPDTSPAPRGVPGHPDPTSANAERT
ncbi:MAG: gamma-glutamyl-gamma-aminobutyrate hydrolase family protein [Acidimicrobiales bacterium]|jgi:gamma-glutamyl-gamma-aminobutyrate hydrolase PuuD